MDKIRTKKINMRGRRSTRLLGPLNAVLKWAKVISENGRDALIYAFSMNDGSTAFQRISGHHADFDLLCKRFGVNQK